MHAESAQLHQTKAAAVKAPPPSGTAGKRISEPFRYYIHDSIESFRIELVGDLSAPALHDLAGCCHTASATIRGRRVILDVRRLRAVDEAGCGWLRQMKSAGAMYATAYNQQQGFVLGDDWKPAPATEAERSKASSRLRAWLRLDFSSSSAKPGDEVEAPWAGCQG